MYLLGLNKLLYEVKNVCATHVALEVPLGLHVLAAEPCVEDGLLVLGLLHLLRLHRLGPFVRLLEIRREQKRGFNLRQVETKDAVADVEKRRVVLTTNICHLTGA